MTPFDLTPSSWDSDYLNIPCGKLVLHENLSPTNQDLLLSLLTPYKWLTIRNPKDCTLNNIWLPQYTGAYLVDINISFNKTITPTFTPIDTNISISNKFPYNHELISLSENLYIYSRFFNDPLYPQEKALSMYSSWVKNAFNREDKYFCISTKNNELLGFILFNLTDLFSATIELIGVNKTYQNAGIGSKLLHSLEHYLNQHHIKQLYVGTQIQNLSAINFYTKKGFSTCDIHYTYHKWS